MLAQFAYLSELHQIPLSLRLNQNLNDTCKKTFLFLCALATFWCIYQIIGKSWIYPCVCSFFCDTDHMWCGREKTSLLKLHSRTKKAQRTQGLNSFTKLTSFLIISYHKFLHKSWSNFSLKILTKLQLQNLNQTSAPNSRLNLNFEILTELKLQNLDQNKCPKSEHKFSFKNMTKL